ncbi:Cytochrome P450 6d1 [Pseudolycoriella hygida]|uniref:Cytochrome P450 6d1 n=1 Tax=Pseudolycoriella hygida TaxID=35572 RepID=A0A9Q0ND15_9DIPT|nr:Cytochrome P450 6d1 [Pseudolycoriella hygida]
METLPARHPIYLYPHDTDHYILIVPRRYKSKTEYDFIFKSPLLLVWAPMTAIVAIMRFLFKKIKKTDKTLVGISLETFGLSLGMSFSDTVSSAAENFLLWCFCLGTMLSGMLLSSEMFRGFALHVDILAINNLEELETSGMKTVAPFGSESIKYFFNNIPQNLKWKYSISYDISDMIQRRNRRYAYVIRESKFNILFSKDKDAWHVIERFGYEHLSYKLRKFSLIEDRMNTIIQRCVDHGIVKYLKEKNKRILIGIKPTEQTKDNEAISTNVKPLSLSDMKNSFLLAALGLLLIFRMLHRRSATKISYCWVLFRVCNEDYQVPDTNLIVPKGTEMMIPVLDIHRNPDIYHNAMEFRPERFLNSSTG